MPNIGTWAVRDLHVSATNRECIRHVRSKMRPEALAHEHRETRHAVYRDALDAHARNLLTYGLANFGAPRE